MALMPKLQSVLSSKLILQKSCPRKSGDTLGSNLEVRSWFIILWIFAISIGTCFAEALQVSEGVSYEHRTTKDPLSIHILRVDPAKARITPVRAWNFGLGREPLSSMSERRGAVASVNGGFFEIGGASDGRPTGILKIQGQWFALPSRPRGAIGWSDNTSPLFDRLLTQAIVFSKKNPLTISAINSNRNPYGIGLYSGNAQKTTLTPPGGTEVAIVNGAVTKVYAKAGDSPIPENGWVLSYSKELEPPAYSEGDPAHIEISILPQLSQEDCTQWKHVDHIVGGTPLLIKNGLLCMDVEKEQIKEGFVDIRHPRTAVGTLPNGHWIFVVVDGRNKESQGMTVSELQDFMASLGCTNALNLDGGGSSTMVFKGKVVNTPSGKIEEKNLNQERPISDGIVIVDRETLF
jgi:hypothetical protein